MEFLHGKTIVVFSSQRWGRMRVSKHHYALELAKKGNDVYYIDPPLNNFNKVDISQIDQELSLYVVKSGLSQLKWLRFHSTFLFRLYNRINLARINRAIGKKIDIIWNFEFYGFCDFNFYKEQLKIAHPVDFIQEGYHAKVVGADIIFSVAREILEEVEEYNIPSHFINHSINEEFIGIYSGKGKHEKIQVGYVGNLLRDDINYDIIIKLVARFQDCQFNFIGNYSKSNISEDPSNLIQQKLEILMGYSNTRFLGVLDKETLVAKMSQMEIFLICYDERKDFCRGTNYHKVLEYLAVGKVVVSNHISTYQNHQLIEMVKRGATELEFTSLFNRVVENLYTYNSMEKITERRNFALDNTYSKNLNRIERILSEKFYNG